VIFDPTTPINVNRGPDLSTMHEYKRENKVVTDAGIFNHYSSYNDLSLGPIPPPRKLKRKMNTLETI